MSRILIALGASAPHFTADAVIDGQVESNVTFAPTGPGYKVLIFYTGDFIDANADLLGRLNMLVSDNCTVTAVSVDTIPVHVQWLKGLAVEKTITIFSDVSRRISALYSALSPDGPSIPSVYIIDNSGKFRYIQYTDGAVDLEHISKVIENLRE